MQQAFCIHWRRASEQPPVHSNVNVREFSIARSMAVVTSGYMANNMSPVANVE